MKITIIVATGLNWAICKGGSLPWRLKEDMEFFRKTTMGHAVIMGRKTFESLPGPLQGRANFVVTKTMAATPGVQRASSLADAIRMANGMGCSDAFIIGGQKLYKEALPWAGRILLTRINVDVVGADTFFPNYAEIRDADFSKFSCSPPMFGSNGMQYEMLTMTKRGFEE